MILYPNQGVPVVSQTGHRKTGNSDNISFRQALALLVLSAALVAVSFQLQGHLGLSLSDEGFLWYGAQRVRLGEVPIRDFMAYDLGRYYWSAAIMSLLDSNGVVASRLAAAAFQVIGVFFCLFILVCHRKVVKVGWFILAMSTLVLWMYPRHKLFDVTLSIILIVVLGFCIEHPTRWRFLITGFVIGLVAVFGRNHGVYGALGMVGAMIYLIPDLGCAMIFARFWFWLGGVALGYFPVIASIFTVSGFGSAFLESIQFLFEFGGTNLPLPIPWPWKVDFQQVWLEVSREVIVGSFFVSLLLFGVLGLSVLIRSKRRGGVVSSVLVAAVLLTLPYAHFAFSRADINHLAQGIFPFLIGMLILLEGRHPTVEMAATLVLFGATLFVMLPQHPGWQFYRAGNWTNIRINGETLIVDRSTAADVAFLSLLVERYASGERPFLVMPYWPGAYAAFTRKAPMWEIFGLFPRSRAFQQSEIARIKHSDPAFALLIDYGAGGSAAVRFKARYPLIDQYIKKNFTSVAMANKVGPFRVYVNKRIAR